MLLVCDVGEDSWRVPWTARRSNQSILKEIIPGCSLEGMMLKLKLPSTLATSCEELTHWKRLWWWEVKVKSPSRVQLFVTLWTIAHQAPLSMVFSEQEYWSGLPFPSPEDLPDPGIESRYPALRADASTSEPPLPALDGKMGTKRRGPHREKMVR